MREIKFRAWDRKGYGMFYNIQKGIDFGDESHYCFCNFIQKKDYGFHDWTLMQYTGLKDKNEKEIWEGDILAYKAEKKTKGHWYICGSYGFHPENSSPVVYRNGCFEWDNKILYSELLWHEGYGGLHIIGNIYENPKLIKEKNHE